ncbi:hypothetical protein cce_1044 [Crocosphaera subtropica ATCC 51142]|uniref:Uncharacterized protein n=1 Tax=Crocosphaera subtropica (strain ATCC 51142 / BH68) TaxID=43989 RepID=B1WTS9_CROS5|nr:hypothetical protein [Crocosphaera subtropica]ACB50395.1 hypothetical protein cce_1044 [Crocosphaera subtropica ATCC 51142]
MVTANSKQPLGTILQEAKLITPYQVETALNEQKKHPQRRLGEILAEKGWIKQQTADFFAEEWEKVLTQAQQGTPQSLGYYLREAGLIDDYQLDDILAEQGQGRMWMRIGALAVLKGWLNQTTVDFLLTHLHPDKAGDSPFIRAKQ